MSIKELTDPKQPLSEHNNNRVNRGLKYLITGDDTAIKNAAEGDFANKYGKRNQTLER